MRCINCGEPLSDENAIFCEKCYKEAVAGAEGKSEDMAEVSAPSKRNIPNNNKNKKGKKITRNTLIVIASVLAVLILIPAIWITSVFGKIQKENLSGDLGINENVEVFSKDIKNIALFGLDTRSNNTTGRSDAILVLTIDKMHNAIKLTSIARDTYIEYENGKHDKITHAWANGKANLSVKTINRNFNLDITDYVAVNFYQFAEIIDYIGGVMIDVDSAEMKVMNNNYITELNNLGIKCEPITKTGMQLLNGGQALAYSRNRYTGSDLTRGNRQREVLAAMFDAAKSMNKAKFPKLVEMILERCTTSLSSSEMLSVGTWALTKSPEIKNLGIPNSELKAGGQMINGTSYMVYDLDKASKIIHEFIYEDGESTSSQTVSEK